MCVSGKISDLRILNTCITKPKLSSQGKYELYYCLKIYCLLSLVHPFYTITQAEFVSENVIADVPLCRTSLHLTCSCISTRPPCCSQVKLPHTRTMSLSLQVAISQPFPWLPQGRATSKSGTIMALKQISIFKIMNNE